MTSLKTLFDLTGRVAVITGGSRGLGLQLAEALGEFGARVVLVSRKQDELNAAAEHLARQAVETLTVAADLGSDPEAADRVLFHSREGFGAVDILVNNAGATWGAPSEHHPMDAWQKVLNLNLTGLFRLTQLVAREEMLPRSKGAILNLASIEGLLGHHPDMTGTAAYNATKGAVINLTRSLAAEWGPRGVRVNALAPGHFPTRMTAGLLGTESARLLDSIPMKKFGNSNDLKGAALLLASDAGGHITGQVLAVDGGATAI